VIQPVETLRTCVLDECKFLSFLLYFSYYPFPYSYLYLQSRDIRVYLSRLPKIRQGTSPFRFLLAGSGNLGGSVIRLLQLEKKHSDGKNKVKALPPAVWPSTGIGVAWAQNDPAKLYFSLSNFRNSKGHCLSLYIDRFMEDQLVSVSQSAQPPAVGQRRKYFSESQKWGISHEPVHSKTIDRPLKWTATKIILTRD
jgi:hypothetical protein